MKIVTCLFLLVFPVMAFGAEPSTRFDQANKLYEESKFAEAATAYEAMVAGNLVSPSVYFNLGNTYFKLGQPGRAIYYYRMAQRLAPRDPDVLANLSFARSSLGGPSAVAPNFLDRLLQRISLNELSLVSAALLWIWFSLLISGRVRPGWREDLRAFSTVTLIALIATGGVLALAANERLARSEGVVIAREAVVRYGPLEESQSAFTLRGGAEFSVIDEKNDWIEIMDRTRRTGWLLRKQGVILPRG